MADRHDRQIRQGIANNTKGTAFVVYEDVMDAKQACDKLNGFNFQNRYLVGMPETMLQTNGFIRFHARANWCKFSTINQKRWQNPKKIWPNDKRTWRSLKSSTALTELMVSVCVCFGLALWAREDSPNDSSFPLQSFVCYSMVYCCKAFQVR